MSFSWSRKRLVGEIPCIGQAILRRKSKLRIEPMRITGQQDPSPQSLQSWMLLDALHHPLAQAASAMRFQHKDVAKIRDRGKVGDHPSESNLSFTIINAKAQRVLDGTLDHFSRNSVRPIAVRQKSVDHIRSSRAGSVLITNSLCRDSTDPVGIGSRPQVDILNWHRRHSGTSMCPGGVPNREGHDFPVVPQQAALAAGVRFEGTPQRLKAAPSTRLESARVKLVPFPVTTEPTA